MSVHGAPLAHEPFTNSPGTAIIGSAGGTGFSGAWQANSSAGVATNTAFGLTYADSGGRALVTAGGAGFFQGLTSANSSMQPIRVFNFIRGTNGTDGVTTWFSFLIARQGPVNGSVTNGWLRGANVPHDNGSLQKLATGNSSGAATNTVGLIPIGSAGNLKPSKIQFGGRTNFVVVRVDHVVGGNDSAWLFVNPDLNAEPAVGTAATNTMGDFDFSFDRVRVFAGGHNSAAAQPYAEIVVDEYRMGETFADVAPYVSPVTNVTLLSITNIQVAGGSLVLSGSGGDPNAAFSVLGSTNLQSFSTNWPVVGSNVFDAAGLFRWTNPLVPAPGGYFFRVAAGLSNTVPVVSPLIVTSPTNLTVSAGQTAVFNVAATGTAPLSYQWYFNTNTALSGETAATLSLANVQFTNAGGYSVRVSNSGGAVTSSVAILTVLSAPVLSTAPQNLTVVVSNAAAFSVAATGTPALGYQWYFNTNTPLANATNAAYSIAVTLTNQAGKYSVVVTNTYGSVTSAVATLTVFVPPTGTVYYVATNGNDANAGTSISAPFKTISKGLTAVGSGGYVFVRGGAYPSSSKYSLSKTATSANRIRLWALPGETPVIDANGNSSDSISLSGDWYHLKGLTVAWAGHNGINISGGNNIVELCTTCSNDNTGIHITGDLNTASNLVLNCDSFRNYDPPTHGQNADGFSAKWIFGTNNVFSGCRAWENADDGWDLWMGTNTVVITNCWAFRNGTNVFGDLAWEGNGNGFKIGGNYVGTPHRTVRSAAFENMANGFDQNNNIDGQTLDNNTSWGNKKANFAMAHGTNTTPHLIRNNISFGGGSSDSFTAGSLSFTNTWQIISEPSVNAADFQSLDSSGAAGPRNAAGALPDLPFLKPVLGGRLVNKGMNVGDPYLGAAPDLGAFEVQ
ncbi:MAG: immunoglobulin domain-containing protein [Verrucomicrobiota bacterium]